MTIRLERPGIPAGSRGEGNRVPSAEELRNRPVFAEGTPAEHPYGVCYQGEYETLHDGTGVAVRKHARALALQGLPVLLRSFSNTVISPDGVPQPVHSAGLHAKVQAEIGELGHTQIAQLTPVIKHVVALSAEHLRSLIMPPGAIHHEPAMVLKMRDAVYRNTIVMSVWERSVIPSEMVDVLNRVAQCWVPCERNREALIGSGVTAPKVHVVPHPFAPADDICKLTRRKPRRGRYFYTIGRWEPRKGYHRLLGAFLRAFRPGENVLLTIKTSGGRWEGYPSIEDSMEQWLGTPDIRAAGWDRETFRKHVTVVAGYLPPDRMLKLHFDHNIYVSPSHGEAWGLGAWDAKLAGNAMVHVPYGGTEDFAGPGDVAVERAGVEEVHPSYRWPADAKWAAFSDQALVDALQKVEPPAVFARPDDYERFTMQSVGKLMAKLCVDVARAFDARGAAYLEERWSGK